MKKYLSVICLLTIVYTLCAQNNVITYTASHKLAEVTSDYDNGIHTYALGASFVSHTFSDGVGTITFSEDVTRIGSSAFYACSGLTSITIPSSVTSIGNSAFSGCSGLTSITIPNSVTSIGDYVFYDCSGLTTITIPNSVTSIGNYAFYRCSSLTSITIPESVTSIGNYAFDDCSGLTSITIPSSVTSIGSSAFGGCSNLTSITIPNSVTSIGTWAFSWCSGLTSIDIPNSVTSIGDYAFYRCSGLTSIVVESGNLKYDSRNNSNAIIETTTNTLIVGCMNTSIPNSVTSIGVRAFSGCSRLTSITIPNSVTSIESSAFSGCSGLSSILIPESVTQIGFNSFMDCTGLSSITCMGFTPPTATTETFPNTPHDIPLYVPASAISAYQTSVPWNEFNIQPLLVEIDSVAQDSANLTWLPVDSAAQYQLRIYSDQVALDTTVIISADPNNGGIMSQTQAAPRRQPRIVLDEISSTVVISIDPNSGASPDQPFVVTVSTSSTNRIDLKYDMTVLGISNNIIRQESGIFTLNEGALLYDALDEVSYSPAFVPSSCFDLRGNSYPLSQWSSLPAGIYILHDGTSVRKILRH